MCQAYIMFQSYDFAIANFFTLAKLYIYNRQCFYDWFI